MARIIWLVLDGITIKVAIVVSVMRRMKMNKGHMIMNIIATSMVILAGMLESIYNPGWIDVINGIASGLVVYVVWMMGKLPKPKA